MKVYKINNDLVFTDNDYVGKTPIAEGSFTADEMKYGKDVKNGKIIIDLKLKENAEKMKEEEKRFDNNSFYRTKMFEEFFTIIPTMMDVIESLADGKKIPDEKKKEIKNMNQRIKILAGGLK